MVAYLEKMDGNTEFHQIMDFLTCSSIYYALTISPIVSTSFVEQFWMTTKSRIVNNISYIDTIVAGKPVTISEASIRSDLLFDDADGIDSLNNQAIFDNIQLMGSKSTSWDQIPTNIATAVIWDEGEASERPSDSQPIPSPPYPSKDQPQTQTDPSPRPSPFIAIPDSNLEGSGGNHGGQSSSDRSLSGNEDVLTLQSLGQEAKERSQTTYHTSQSLDEECRTEDKIGKEDFSNKKGVQKEYVSKQGRKSIKPSKDEPSMHKDPAFDDLDDDAMDYIETEDAQDKGRTSSVVLEEKESADKKVSTEAPVSTVKPNEGTAKRNKGTDKQDGGTDSTKVSIDRQGEGTTDQNEGKSATQTAPTTTSTPTPTIFGDDETIAQVLITMSQNKQKEKEKGVEIRNVEDTKRPRPTSTRSVLTLKLLPKIDLKDKGKKIIDEEGESNTESDDITEAEKKFKMLAKDEEVTRKARINADKILAEELQKEEREKFTIEQRAKFLHDTIVAQRKFLAQQRSEAIRNKPPIRNQLRNQMMTYLKHVGEKKHFELKTKTFEEIQVLYERLKRQDQNFVAIRSAEDERQIKELNKDPKKKRLKKRVVNETPREEDTTKMIARKRPRPQPDDDSDDEHRKCLRIVTFEGTIDSEIMETKSFIARLYKGDLKIMMESSIKENDQGDFWNNQQEWEIVIWRLYEACGVCILKLKDGTVIYMLVERRYPLSKELLQQMIDLGLEVEEESTVALQLVRFIKQQLNEE
ncbi:hypothetical protein Tco_0836695 [Tanacetum coccineum]